MIRRVSISLMLTLISFASAQVKTTPADPPKPTSMAVLKKLDVIHGKLMGITGGKVSWEQTVGKNKLAFPVAEMLYVALPSAPVAKEFTYEVHLTNGDVLPASELALDDSDYSLKTPFAGTLKVPRGLARSIIMKYDDPRFVYRGPKAGDKWLVGKNKELRRYNPKALSLTSTPAYLKMNFPEKFQVSFDIEWEGRFDLQLEFSEKPPNMGEWDNTYYRYQLTPSKVRFSTRRSSSSMGMGEKKELARDGKLRCVFQYGVNGKGCSIDLGGVLQDTQDSSRPLKAQFLSFQSGNITTKVTNIAIVPPEHANQKPFKEEILSVDKKKGSTVAFANGDSMTGKVLSISGGKIKLKSSIAEMSIPLNRVAAIGGLPEDGKARRRPADVRVELIYGHRFVAEIKDVTAETVTCTSENFGTIKVPRKVIRSLSFNLYDEKDASRKRSAERIIGTLKALK